MSKARSSLNSSIPFYPWVYFFIFLISNVLLSYFSLSLKTSLWIGTLGLILPFIVGFWMNPSTSRPEIPLYKVEFFKKIPIGIWAIVITSAIFFRLYHLTGYTVWPHYDEGWIGYYAVQLWNHWNWDFFYGQNQIPPVYTWILALFFKFFGSSLETLWLVPSLLSLLALPLAYQAASSLFSKSFAFVFLVLLSLSYWPWYAARFSEPTAKDLLSVCFIFLCMGLFLKAVQVKNSSSNYFWMGLSVGLSYYLLFIHWFFIAPFISFIVIASAWGEKQNRLKHISVYLIPLFILITPILWLEWKQNYLSIYYQNAGHSPISEFSMKQIFSNFSYISSLFWGADHQLYTYGPIWGGFFNPILGAFFFLGFFESIKNWRQPVYLGLVVSFILFISPGLMTNNLETFRIFPVLPVSLAIMTIGLIKLFNSLPHHKSWLCILLVSFSLLLDINQFRLYHNQWDSIFNWRGYAKSIERYHAYQILKKTAAEKGPGIIFSDFVPGLCDETLSAADGDFNAAENPALTLTDARWAAVLTNINYRPFLDKRFGKTDAYALSKNTDTPDGGWMLWVIPLTKKNKPLFQNWLSASQSLKDFIDLNMGYIYQTSYLKSLDALLKVYPHFQGDRFLESCFWEKAADFVFRNQSKPGSISQPPDKTIEYLQKAIALGYPSAHLYFRLGTLYTINHEPLKAKKAFLKATEAPINFTNADQYLK